MAKVTPGFKLYLYQLLVREIGTGRQTLLPQVEEVLAADDILPADLECATIAELVEACPDFLKLTVFKKGRAYATVVRNEEWDQMLAAPADKSPEPSGAAKKQVGGPKAWKKKKGGKKTLKPVKPGRQRREREAAEAAAAAERAEQERLAAEAAETGAAAACASEDAQAGQQAEHPRALTLAEVLAEAPAEERPSADEARAQEAAVPRPAPVPEPAASGKAAVPVAEEAPEEAAVPVAEPEPLPEPEPPLAPEPEPISLTITYDPYEDMERELARQRAEEQRAAPPATPAPEPPATRTQASVSPVPLADLPQDFGREVSCSDALLRRLYQLLPYDVDPLAVLDEDWRCARSTGSLSGSRSRVSFPMRYLHEDGTPLTVTLRRTARNASGKRWSLALVDGDDGTGMTHDALGMEGLPEADEGAWSDLASGDVPVSPVRELTQQVVLGTWDAVLGALATLAAPEPWNFPGEGVGRPSRYGILREHLALTHHRALCQERVARSADGSFAAWNTGLVTAFGDDIFACLDARSGDIPWQFAGFATAGSGELGARLAGTLAELPEVPTYLSSIEDVMPARERMVILDFEAILTRQLGRLPRAFLAEQLAGNRDAGEILAAGTALSAEDLARLARTLRQDASGYRRMRRALDDAARQAMGAVRLSYRLSVPVYDPTENRTKLLVPLALVDERTVDCALVLDLQPSGTYRAAAALSLPRAYACARVISREQPAWLSAGRVLG